MWREEVGQQVSLLCPRKVDAGPQGMRQQGVTCSSRGSFRFSDAQSGNRCLLSSRVEEGRRLLPHNPSTTEAGIRRQRASDPGSRGPRRSTFPLPPSVHGHLFFPTDCPADLWLQRQTWKQKLPIHCVTSSHNCIR